MKIAFQAAVAAAGLIGYLALCLAYRWKWDAAIRAALSRRLGTAVQWRRVGDSGTLPRWMWHSDDEGPLGRTLRNTVAISAAQYVTAAVLGVLPALGLLWAQLALGFHPLVLLASAFLVIPIAAVFFLNAPVAARS